MVMEQVQQISVFLENKSGRLAEVTRIIADAGINLGALSIAETSDFGILRFICDQPDKAGQALRDAGFSVGETEVLAIQVPHRPGGLAELMAVIQPLGVNIEYLYAFAARTGEDAIVVMRVENERIQEVADALRQADYVVLAGEQAYDV
jgi:hypothetical protein